MLKIFIAATLVAVAAAFEPSCDPTCVDKYQAAYGCFATTIPVPTDDPCFLTIGVGGCLAATCGSPGSKIVDMPYCAPGCNSSHVGDGVCNPECISTDCWMDGGDCMHESVFSYNNLHMLVMDYDVDQDQRLNFSEYQTLVVNETAYNLPMWNMPDTFEKYLSRGEDAIDMWQLGLILVNELPADMMPMLTPEPALSAALKLVWMADQDLDGRLSAMEAEEAYGIEMELYEQMFGDWTVADIADDIMAWFNILGGGDVPDEYNFEVASRGAFVLDLNGDHSLDMHEAMLAHLSPLFAWLDLDADGLVSMEEMRLVLTTMQDDACDGAELLTEREGKIESKIPLPGMAPITCAWLIQPNYYYWGRYEATEAQPVRRSGSAEPSSVRRSGSKSVAATKLRARVHKDTGNVVTLPTSNVNDNVLRQKEHQIRAETAAKTRAFEGMAVDAGAYEFVVSFEGTEGLQICAGALIRADTVLTTAWCAGELKMLMAANPSAITARIGSTQIASGGEQIPVSGVAMHPHYDVDGGFDVGVAWLMFDAAMRPASMYDGGDLGINDCTRMTMSYLGWGADDMLKRAGMGLFDYDECKDMYHWATGMHVVGPEELCAKTKVDEGVVDCKSVASGSPLVVRVPTEPNVTKVVGIASLSEGCLAQGFPALFTRSSSVIQWVMSLDTMGLHPATKIELTVTELGLPMESVVDVYAGGWASADMLLDTLDSKCQVPKTVTDEGTGSMLLVLTVMPYTNETECDGECFRALGMEAEYHLIGCEENFHKIMGSTQADCEMPSAMGIEGCVFEMSPEHGPRCMDPPAPMTVPWSRLGPMEDEGKVYSGGLGKRAVRTHDTEYGVWTCIRDWDAEEQLACGAQKGELCCYWFEEKARRWDFQGLNGDVKLVREAEVMRGMEIEARHLMGRTLRTSPNQMH